MTARVVALACAALLLGAGLGYAVGRASNAPDQLGRKLALCQVNVTGCVWFTSPADISMWTHEPPWATP